MIYRWRDMIYGKPYDILASQAWYNIRSLHTRSVYHRSQSDIISKIYHPFHKERISLKKVTFVGRQKWLFSWSGWWESNPPYRLGKPEFYRWTTSASVDSITQQNENFNRNRNEKNDSFLRPFHWSGVMLFPGPVRRDIRAKGEPLPATGVSLLPEYVANIQGVDKVQRLE